MLKRFMANPGLKIFLDTSALIAGIASSKGSARAVLQLAEMGLIDIVVSQQIIIEADRNIEAKLPEMVNEFREYIQLLSPLLIEDPSPDEVRRYSSIINPEDAPILAAAVSSGANFLLTWDKKHFINRKIQLSSELKIATPGEFLKYFREYIEEFGASQGTKNIE